MNPTLEQVIFASIRNSNGIRSVELCLKVMDVINPQVFDTHEYHEALKKLVDNRDIVEFEYISPDHEYRIKSIYFVKGTSFQVNGVVI